MGAELIPRPDADQVEAIVARLVAGEHEREIEASVSGEMSIEQRDRLLGAVADRLRLASKCDRDMAVGFALEAYRQIYKDARAIGDIAQARGAIKDWVTLALRHNVLDDGDFEEEESDEEGVVEPSPAAASEGQDREPSRKGRRAQAPRKPEAARRASPAVRRPRSPKTA